MTVIASLGRSITTYDLLDNLRNQYGIDTREAHTSIHAFLAQIVEVDGEDDVILDTTPMRPELLVSNPQDVDVYYWITISDGAEQDIRDAFAAVYSGTEGDETNAIHYTIEISDDGVIWDMEKDEARGTEATDGETPAAIARTILDNRIADLATDDLKPGHMRVRVWVDEDAPASGAEPLAEAATV